MYGYTHYIHFHRMCTYAGVQRSKRLKELLYSYVHVLLACNIARSNCYSKVISQQLLYLKH